MAIRESRRFDLPRQLVFWKPTGVASWASDRVLLAAFMCGRSQTQTSIIDNSVTGRIIFPDYMAWFRRRGNKLTL
jgi:hypothetical protein